MESEVQESPVEVEEEALAKASAATLRRRLVSKAPPLHNRITLIITTSPWY